MITMTRILRTILVLTALAPCVLLPCLGWAAPHISRLSVPHFLQAAAHKPPHRHSVYESLSAGTVTGRYDGPNKASLDVLQLPGRRIQFDLVALADSSSPGGPRTGESSGVVALHNGVAVYKPDSSQSDGASTTGSLILQFRGGKVVVSQQGQMPGYGMGVTASGTYIRHSRKPPKFNKDGQAI